MVARKRELDHCPQLSLGGRVSCESHSCRESGCSCLEGRGSCWAAGRRLSRNPRRKNTRCTTSLTMKSRNATPSTEPGTTRTASYPPNERAATILYCSPHMKLALIVAHLPATEWP